MATCLVLTSPYAYGRALKRALEIAKEEQTSLCAVFLIDPAEVRRLVEDLGEKGWLGPGSVRALEEAMRAGYRALAEDVLAEVRRQAEAQGIAVEAEVMEGDLVQHVHALARKGFRKLIVGGRPLADQLRGLRGVKLVVEE